MPHFVITGPSITQHWPFPDLPVIVIGRSTLCDLALSDPKRKISQTHAAVVRIPRDEPGKQSQWMLRDLGSRHSTKLSRDDVWESVDQILLRDGDVVDLPGYQLQFWSHEAVSSPISRIRVVGSKTPDVGTPEKTVTCIDLGRHAGIDEAGQELFEQIAYLCSRGGSVKSVLTELLPGLLRYLAADRGVVEWFKSPDTGEFEEVAFAELRKGQDFRITERSFVKILRNRQIIQDHDTLLVPICSEQNVAGFFCIERLAARPFLPREIEFLSGIGDAVLERLGQSVSRDARLRKEEEHAGLHKWPAALVGISEPMRALNQAVQIAAKSGANVLLYGENGTGKELVAQAIHALARIQRKRSGKHIAVNCAAMPESVAESELFGHKKGAFTGADADKEGLFDEAKGGSLFLDEIQATAYTFQAKLLRVLIDKKVRPLGTNEQHHVDVQIIVAMDKEPTQAIEDGSFARALYERFENKIAVPELRQRREDIPLLAFYFLDMWASPPDSGAEKEADLTSLGVNQTNRQNSTAAQRKTWSISHRALELLTRYDWPGNVRQLSNCIRDAVAQNTEIILSTDLPPIISAPVKPDEDDGGARKPLTKVGNGHDAPKSLRQVEKEHIKRLLEDNLGNIAKTARQLGVADQGLRNKMKRYEIAPGYGRKQ